MGFLDIFRPRDAGGVSVNGDQVIEDAISIVKKRATDAARHLNDTGDADGALNLLALAELIEADLRDLPR